MVFRTGETLQFPFDRDDRKVWYAIIEYDITGFHETAYTSSKSGKADLLAALMLLRSSSRKYLLLGIWMGEWKTDLFILDPSIVRSRMK
jgi:hypothetical protein